MACIGCAMFHEPYVRPAGGRTSPSAPRLRHVTLLPRGGAARLSLVPAPCPHCALRYSPARHPAIALATPVRSPLMLEWPPRDPLCRPPCPPPRCRRLPPCVPCFTMPMRLCPLTSGTCPCRSSPTRSCARSRARPAPTRGRALSASTPSMACTWASMRSSPRSPISTANRGLPRRAAPQASRRRFSRRHARPRGPPRPEAVVKRAMGMRVSARHRAPAWRFPARGDAGLRASRCPHH
jgi:hypothetical protein